MAEVLQVEVFVARHQFVTVYPVSVYQKFQEIGWHGTVVDEAAHSASLSFFDFRLQLLYDFVAACGIVYQDIRVARNLDAIAAVHPIAWEDSRQIGFDDVFDEHQVVVFTLFRQFDEAGYLAVGQLHYEVLRLCIRHILLVEAYCQVEAVVAQEGDNPVFGHRYGSQIRENLFAEEAADKLLMKIFYLSALIEDDVMFAQGRQYFGLVDADTVFQLSVHFPVDFIHQFDGRLYAFVVFRCFAGSNGLVVGYTYLVEFFKVRRIDGDKVNAFVQRQ